MYMVLFLYSVIGADVEQWKLDLAQKLGTDLVINVKEQDIKQVIWL